MCDSVVVAVCVCVLQIYRTRYDIVFVGSGTLRCETEASELNVLSGLPIEASYQSWYSLYSATEED
jgi:hypothetical protein